MKTKIQELYLLSKSIFHWRSKLGKQFRGVTETFVNNGLCPFCGSEETYLPPQNNLENQDLCLAFCTSCSQATVVPFKHEYAHKWYTKKKSQKLIQRPKKLRIVSIFSITNFSIQQVFTDIWLVNE